MTTYSVTKVRKESGAKGDHKHIVGVITSGGIFHRNQAVVDSIKKGDEWHTTVTGAPPATIREQRFCPATSCMHSPYLTTEPDHTTKNNLESLPEG